MVAALFYMIIIYTFTKCYQIKFIPKIHYFLKIIKKFVKQNLKLLKKAISKS